MESSCECNVEPSGFINYEQVMILSKSVKFTSFANYVNMFCDDLCLDFVLYSHQGQCWPWH